MDVTSVVFDIGNVLVRWDVRALYRTVFDDVDEMERFLQEVWTPAENDRCDRGEPFATVIAETISRHPQYAGEIALMWDRWIETIPGPVPGTNEILVELADAGVPVFALSNFSAETFPLIRDAHPSFERFNDVVLSGEHAPHAKPDAAIFMRLLERNGLTAASTLFIDDAPANVDAAAALGFHTVLFTDAEALRGTLVELGLLDR